MLVAGGARVKAVRNEAEIGGVASIEKTLPGWHVVDDEQPALQADIAVGLLAQGEVRPESGGRGV